MSLHKSQRGVNLITLILLYSQGFPRSNLQCQKTLLKVLIVGDAARQDNTAYKHKRQTSVSSAGFEPAIPATKRQQTYILDRVISIYTAFIIRKIL
jgi:hypothetical protein